MSRRTAFKRRSAQLLPFCKGMFFGALIMFVYSQCALSHSATEETKRFMELTKMFGPVAITHAEEQETIVLDPTPDTILARQLTRELFKKDAKVMFAVFKAESGLNPKAKGWNCKYVDSKGNKYSAACRVEDRYLAYSVDCGIAQNNFPGQECPEYSLDTEWSIREAHRKYSSRGFSPWVAWQKGRYLPFLNEL